MKDALETTGAVTLIIGFIGMMIFMPVITFGFAYFGGWILQLCVGDMFYVRYYSNYLRHIGYDRQIF